MDDYGLERPELNGSLMSMEFGPGGRIHQLWVTDPGNPEETEEFQFVAPPVTMGEELAEDYYPGTILLGARTDPDDPWIVSRNARADIVGDEDDPSSITFRYEFSFLEDLDATGRFYEIPGRVPQIVWELQIVNRSRRSIEIGELGFPLALNNVLDGFPRDDRGVRELFHDRVHVHKFVGSSASYIMAQRMHGRPPGLMIYPGGDTKWEFYNHVPASLHSTFQWEGVPVVYIHSRAAIEREEWPEWFYGHTSTVLEPGETRRYEMRFAPLDTHLGDNVRTGLASVGRPAIRLFPGAVAPVDASIGLEVSGSTPTRFWSDPDLEMESDSDEEGGFCALRSSAPGTFRVGFEDTAGRDSETQVLFTLPIGELVRARSTWILANQVVQTGPLAGAIVAADNETGDMYSDLRHFASPFALKGSLGEALFLAEKNVVYPDSAEVAALDRYLSDFIEGKVRNPSDGAIGCVLPTSSGTAACFGYADVYPISTLLYGSMARVARYYGGTRHSADAYLRKGYETAVALWKHVLDDSVAENCIPQMAGLVEFADQLHAAGLETESSTLRNLLRRRWHRLSKRKYVFASGGYWDAAAFEEAYAVARQSSDLDLKERILRCLLASRSAAPCWWWNGSDKRWGAGVDMNDAAVDNGELCLGAPTVANSGLLLSLFGKDYASLPEGIAQMAFAGMLSVWALVREDGAAGMAFCPDAASGHFGMAATTGDIGIALYHYLRHAGAHVLPSLGTSLAVFGGSFDVEEEHGVEVYTVRPWDGVGRKVVVRQIGIDIACPTGRIAEVRFDARKRKARISLQNEADKELETELSVRGLWGRRIRAAGTVIESVDGEFRIPVKLAIHDTTRIDIEVSE